MLKAIRELKLLAYWRYVLAEPRIFKSGLMHGRIYVVDDDTGEITEQGKHHKNPVRAMSYDVGCEAHDILKRANNWRMALLIGVFWFLVMAALIVIAGNTSLG